LWSRVGDAQRAERAYREALWINSHYPDALFNLGLLLQKEGRPLEAKEAYEQLISLTRAARFFKAYYNLGVLAAEREDWQNAIQYYEQWSVPAF